MGGNWIKVRSLWSLWPDEWGKTGEDSVEIVVVMTFVETIAALGAMTVVVLVETGIIVAMMTTVVAGVDMAVPEIGTIVAVLALARAVLQDTATIVVGLALAVLTIVTVSPRLIGRTAGALGKIMKRGGEDVVKVMEVVDTVQRGDMVKRVGRYFIRVGSLS
jgi:hypothetical protein